MFESLKKKYKRYFGTTPEYVFSAPGRTELSGNHTDHQHGLVLAAAVELCTVAAVSKNEESVIYVQSSGYPLFEINLNDLSLHPSEINTTAALIRGIAARVKELGYKPGGFSAYVESSVLPGSGLSSSAAFEVLLGKIMNHLFCNNELSSVQIAQIGQYAENNYFGKPCVLMDQMASSVGNIINIDFCDPETPIVTPIDYDFSNSGYHLCIVDSGANHAALTDEYAAIPAELGRVCAFFDKQWIRQIDEKEFYQNIKEIRIVAGDRAVLRAMHMFDENNRVKKQVDALKHGDIETFLQMTNESGQSSWMYLQNIIPTGNVMQQELATLLAITKKLLDGRGACRVHGGGFAGTIQAFVPDDVLTHYVSSINAMLGKECCHVMEIRHDGARLETVN